MKVVARNHAGTIYTLYTGSEQYTYQVRGRRVVESEAPVSEVEDFIDSSVLERLI